MLKRICALALLALIPCIANSEAGYQKLTVTSTAETVTVNAPSVLIINADTTNEVYLRVFWDGETVADATTSSIELAPNATGLQFTKSISIKAVSLVCASGETAVVKVIWF